MRERSASVHARAAVTAGILSETGEIQQASLFVAVLGASSYTYAEATLTQELEPWIGAHIRAFEFLGGVPQLIVPDNARTAVTKACRYEPDLNPTYQEMAMPLRRGRDAGPLGGTIAMIPRSSCHGQNYSGRAAGYAPDPYCRPAAECCSRPTKSQDRRLSSEKA